MEFFDNIFNQLFPKNERNHPKNPVISESLKRSEKDQQLYFKWVNEKSYAQFFERIKEAYYKKRVNIADKLQVHILQMPYANGFAVTFLPTFISQKEFQHAFDLLKDKTLNLGYQLNTSNRRIFDKGEYIQTIEKYYLKPIIDIKQANELFDQKYGNIIIELYFTDNQPSYLKYVANIYSDRLYTVALKFDDLVKELFV